MAENRDLLEATCAAIAQAEAHGFEGTAAALRLTLKELLACAPNSVSKQITPAALEPADTYATDPLDVTSVSQT